MKKDTHPTLNNVCFVDTTTGKRYFSRSTMKSAEKETVDGEEYFIVHCSVTADSHPIFTGEKRLIDTAGRIDKFKQRYSSVKREKRRKLRR